jgi:hypothetical protein
MLPNPRMLLKTNRAKMKVFHIPTIFMKTGMLCSDTHDIAEYKGGYFHAAILRVQGKDGKGR